MGEEEGKRKATSVGGAARLTNRSIVGEKTIRSLTVRPGSSSLSPFPFLSVSLPLSVSPHVHLRNPRARLLAEGRGSRPFRSRIYLPLRRTGRRLPG